MINKKLFFIVILFFQHIIYADLKTDLALLHKELELLHKKLATIVPAGPTQFVIGHQELQGKIKALNPVKKADKPSFSDSDPQILKDIKKGVVLRKTEPQKRQEYSEPTPHGSELSSAAKNIFDTFKAKANVNDKNDDTNGDWES